MNFLGYINSWFNRAWFRVTWASAIATTTRTTRLLLLLLQNFFHADNGIFGTFTRSHLCEVSRWRKKEVEVVLIHMRQSSPHFRRSISAPFQYRNVLAKIICYYSILENIFAADKSASLSEYINVRSHRCVCTKKVGAWQFEGCFHYFGGDEQTCVLQSSPRLPITPAGLPSPSFRWISFLTCLSLS